MIQLVQAVSAFVDLDGRLGGDEQDSHRSVIQALEAMCASVDEALRHGLSDQEILRIIQPARAVHARSPFWQHVYQWPRGVVGDYMTIEWLCSGLRQAPTGSVAAHLEHHLFTFPPAVQHRNKVRWQAEQISLSVRRGAEKVLSVGCGGCLDLRACGDVLRGRTQFILNDVDGEAIRFALTHLTEIQGQVRVVEGNLLRSLRRFQSLGPFDLIVAGGLFDYLDDSLFRRALGRLFECLVSGGRVCLTNYGTPNPYRTWMKYFGDWTLFERSEAELRQLVSAACGPEAMCSVAPEDTGLTWLVSVDRPCRPPLPEHQLGLTGVPWGGPDAEPGAAPDRRGMTAFRGSLPT